MSDLKKLTSLYVKAAEDAKTEYVKQSLPLWERELHYRTAMEWEDGTVTHNDYGTDRAQAVTAVEMNLHGRPHYIEEQELLIVRGGWRRLNLE